MNTSLELPVLVVTMTVNHVSTHQPIVLIVMMDGIYAARHVLVAMKAVPHVLVLQQLVNHALAYSMMMMVLAQHATYLAEQHAQLLEIITVMHVLMDTMTSMEVVWLALKAVQLVQDLKMIVDYVTLDLWILEENVLIVIPLVKHAPKK